MSKYRKYPNKKITGQPPYILWFFEEGWDANLVLDGTPKYQEIKQKFDVLPLSQKEKYVELSRTQAVETNKIYLEQLQKMDEVNKIWGIH